MTYETKPMKKQWIEVDGRLTPIILPQIWNHELQDWVVTSEQNPLPTQLYGSIVELFNEEVEVSAGAFVGVTPNFMHDGSQKEAFCTVVADAEHEFETRLQLREGSHNMFQYTNDNNRSNASISGNLQTVLPKIFITDRVRIALRNDDSVNHIYKVRLGVIK